MKEKTKVWLGVIVRIGCIIVLMIGASILGHYYPISQSTDSDDLSDFVYQYLIIMG